MTNLFLGREPGIPASPALQMSPDAGQYGNPTADGAQFIFLGPTLKNGLLNMTLVLDQAEGLRGRLGVRPSFKLT